MAVRVTSHAGPVLDLDGTDCRDRVRWWAVLVQQWLENVITRLATSTANQ